MKVRMLVPLALVISDNTLNWLHPSKCSSISDAPFLLLPTLSPTVFSKCSFQGWFQGMESRRRSPWIFGSTPLSLTHLLKSVLYFGNSYILLGNLGGNGNKQAREGQDWWFVPIDCLPRCSRLQQKFWSIIEARELSIQMGSQFHLSRDMLTISPPGLARNCSTALSSWWWPWLFLNLLLMWDLPTTKLTFNSKFSSIPWHLSSPMSTASIGKTAWSQLSLNLE